MQKMRCLVQTKLLVTALFITALLAQIMIKYFRQDSQCLLCSSLHSKGLTVYITRNDSHTFMKRPDVHFETRADFIFDAPSRSMDTEMHLLHESAFHNFSQNVSYETCPNCFRPPVPSFTKLLVEIPIQKVITEDQPRDFFRQRPEILQPLVTQYLITPSLACPYLLVLQLSVINRRQEREAVRETWGSVSKQKRWPHRKVNSNVNVVFVVAKQVHKSDSDTRDSLNEAETNLQWDELQAEADKHGDILYVNMIEGYSNLTLKLLSAFKWVKDNCPCVKFVLKVDYDTFVNVPLLVDTLLYFENKFEFSIVGMVYTRQSKVLRAGRWSVDKEMYPMSIFPLYCSGCGYVISYKALSKMVEAAPHIPMFPVEDAFITGVLRNVVECQLFSLQTLFTHYLDKTWDKCRMFGDLKIVGTNVNETGHRELWTMFENNGLHCLHN